MNYRSSLAVALWAISLLACREPSAAERCAELHRAPELTSNGSCTGQVSNGAFVLAKDASALKAPKSGAGVWVYQFADNEDLEKARGQIPPSRSAIPARKYLVVVDESATQDELTAIKRVAAGW